MQENSAYPNRRNRRLLMKINKSFKNKNRESVYEYMSRVSLNIKNGYTLHNNHLDRVMKQQEEIIMDRELKYRKLLKDSGKTKKEIDTSINRWYDIVFKEKNNK